MVDLIWSHASKKLVLFLTLMLVGVVAAAPDDSDQIGRCTCIWLLIEDGPVFVLVGEIARAERVFHNYGDRKQGGNRPQYDRQDPEALSVLKVLLDQEWHHDEELKVTGKVPCPGHAAITGRPRYKVVDECHMPDPVLTTLIHVFVLKEEGTFTAEQWNDAPEEEKGEGVEGPESRKSRQDQDTLVAW